MFGLGPIKPNIKYFAMHDAPEDFVFCMETDQKFEI
jgi:hypothetical protein